MPDGPFATPDEQRLMRMLAEAGTPQGAAAGLLSRLEALEALAAEVEAALDAQEAAAESEPAPETPGGPQ